jgi:hypothetical protein
MFFLLWCALCALVAVAAKQRGRDPTAWFLLSLVISPLFGLLLLIAFPVQYRGARVLIPEEGPRDWVQAGMGERSIWPQAIALTFLVMLVLYAVCWWFS